MFTKSNLSFLWAWIFLCLFYANERKSVIILEVENVYITDVKEGGFK